MELGDPPSPDKSSVCSADCSWELIAYVTNLSRDTIKKEQFWIPSEHKGWQQPFTITPIKSMQSELLDMQLYVEHPGG
jgi:mitotic spindle assembly checkpoint protein MAD2B